MQLHQANTIEEIESRVAAEGISAVAMARV